MILKDIASMVSMDILPFQELPTQSMYQPYGIFFLKIF